MSATGPSNPRPRQRPNSHRTRRWIPYLGAVVLVGLIIAGLWPKPIPVEVHEKLQEFLSSLRAFNAAAHDRTHSLPGPPPSITDGSLLVLLENLHAQLRYQEMALVARPEDPPNLALERSGSAGRSAP